MGYKCCILQCKTNQPNGEKGSVAEFPTNEEDKQAWIRFVNRKDWVCSKHSRLCLLHFDNKYIKHGKKNRYLNRKLRPIPTIHVDSTTPPSLLVSTTLPRKPPAPRIPPVKELFPCDDVKDITSFTPLHSPSGFTFSVNDEGATYYRLAFQGSPPIPKVKETVHINADLGVTLMYENIRIPAPEFLRRNKGKITKFSQLPRLVESINERVSELPPSEILDELRAISLYKPRGRPPYKTPILRWSLLVRYTSAQSYRLLLHEFPLPSFPLLRRLQQGTLNALKAAKLLLNEGKISEDIVLLFDEMFLQKLNQYTAGKMIGKDADGELYKGVMSFMIVGLKESVAMIVKAIPECTISGEWLMPEIESVLRNLIKIGFKVRAVICDDHGTNVNAYSRLSKKYGSMDDLFIIFEGYKIYLLFDPVHLVKNVRNNLLAAKKFVFPAFHFAKFRDEITVTPGYMDWRLLHTIYERDLKLAAHFKMGHAITYRALHPGNKKQDVNLALSIFRESTSASIRRYLPKREDAASFLNLINVWWTISNSKSKFNNQNYLGNAAVRGDGKIEFLQKMADWIEEWCECPHYTLTPQTAAAMIKTLRGTAALLNDLFDEGYEYVRTAVLQSDPLERRYGVTRMMHGGHFLVSLVEFNTSDKILLMRSLLKENIIFWEEDVFDEKPSVNEELESEIASLSDDIANSSLTDETLEVSLTVAGYIAKEVNEKLSCEKCKEHLISEDGTGVNKKYLDLLSRGGLTVPDATFADYVSHLFAALDVIELPLMKHAKQTIRMSALDILSRYFQDYTISCADHEKKVRKIVMRCAVNTYFSNKQKRDADIPRENNLEVFKRSKIDVKYC